MFNDAKVEDETVIPDDQEQAESGNGQAGPINYDWNDPALADESADEINPDQDADEFPPPPPDGIYTVNWDFAEPEEEKRWITRQGQKGKFIMVGLVGTIVDCDDPKIPDRRWINRKLRTFIMTIPTNDGTSSMTDFEKSIGLKAAVIKISKMNKKPDQFNAHREVITEAMSSADPVQGKVAVQWTGGYKRIDAEDKPEYMRPGGKLNNGEKIDKNHPIQNFRGMNKFPFKTKWDDYAEKEVRVVDDAGNDLRSPIKLIIDPDSGEEVEVRASAEVRTFIPRR